MMHVLIHTFFMCVESATEESVLTTDFRDGGAWDTNNISTIRTLHLCVSDGAVEDIQLFEHGYMLIPPVGRFSLGRRGEPIIMIKELDIRLVQLFNYNLLLA